MIAEPENLWKVAGIEGGVEDVHLAAHLLAPQPRLEQRAGRGAIQVLPDQRVDAEHREALLREQDLAARPPDHGCQQLEVFDEQCLVDDVAGSWETVGVESEHDRKITNHQITNYEIAKYEITNYELPITNYGQRCV